MTRNRFPWYLCCILASIVVAQNVGVSFDEVLGRDVRAAESSIHKMASTSHPVQTQETPKPVFETDDLLKQRAESGQAYLPFINIPTMNLGMYSLPKGGTDGQSPHDLDEIYYVVNGKAKIEIEGTKHDVKPGAIIFVAAHDQHRFVEIEEDIDLLVFFSKAKPTGDGE